MSILIVDDAEGERKLLRKYLQRLGFKDIAEAADGNEAYRAMLGAKASQAHFDLVISDRNMPGLDGIGLLKALRERKEWEHLPFILLTSQSEKNKVIEAVLARVTSYLVKPIEEEALKLKLTQVWQAAQKVSGPATGT